MSQIDRVSFDGRAMLAKGIVVAVRDDGAAQLVDVQTHDGAVYGDVEVWQPAGVSSVPVADGALAMVLAVGGDAAHRIAFLYNQDHRFGGVAPGEAVLHGSDGSRVGARSGGRIEIYGMTEVDIQSPAVSLKAPGGVSITGPVSISGAVSMTGNVTITGNLVVNGGHVTGTGTVRGPL